MRVDRYVLHHHMSSMNEEATVTKSNVSFLLITQNNCGCYTGNNGHSAKVRLWLGYITLLHIPAMFNKTSFEQRGVLHQDYYHLGQNKTFKILRL